MYAKEEVSDDLCIACVSSLNVFARARTAIDCAAGGLAKYGKDEIPIFKCFNVVFVVRDFARLQAPNRVISSPVHRLTVKKKSARHKFETEEENRKKGHSDR